MRHANGPNGTVLLLSGGMDSATLLWQQLTIGRNVLAVSVHYGQRHSKELAAAEKLVKLAREDFGDSMVEHMTIPMSWLASVLPGSSQTDGSVDVPEGHYADETMRATVVPNRNMVMLAIANAIGIALGYEFIAYGAHAGDHDIYPDCRQVFVAAMAEAIALSHYPETSLRLVTPFIGKDKGDIARIGVELGVPYEFTWTCYKGEEKPCCVCGACVERAEAFEKVGVPDPLVLS
jgi:7-cyano-7-deazaguanine synthase